MAKKKSRKRAKKAKTLESQIAVLAKKVTSEERSLSRMRGNAHRRAAVQRDTEGRIRRKAVEAESLRTTLDIVSNHLKVVAEERASAARDLKTAQKEWEAVQKRVKKDGAFGATKDAVAAVDAEIERLRRKAVGLEKKVNAVDGRAATARAALAAVEKERRDAQDALQRLPNEIRAARGQVARLLGDVNGAAPGEAARVGAAHPAIREALDDLKAHVHGTSDHGLARSLVDTTAVRRASDRNEREMARLSKAKETLARTQAELQTRVEQRENDIRSRVLKDKAKPA